MVKEINIETTYSTRYTGHFRFDRKDRYNLIKEKIGLGKIIRGFLWDRGHQDGSENHYITDTGIVIIHNARTHKLVTMFPARPQQIKRYWDMQHKTFPREYEYLLEKAKENQNHGYNL